MEGCGKAGNGKGRTQGEDGRRGEANLHKRHKKYILSKI
jgi:hypothetical protein